MFSTGGPRCPNHNEPLYDLPFPMQAKGQGTCPVSGARFDFEMELDQENLVKDINGNLMPSKKWHAVGEE